MYQYKIITYHICGVMSSVDRRWSHGRVKSKIMKLVCVASPLCTQNKGEIANTGWLGIG